MADSKNNITVTISRGIFLLDEKTNVLYLGFYLYLLSSTFMLIFIDVIIYSNICLHIRLF